MQAFPVPGPGALFKAPASPYHALVSASQPFPLRRFLAPRHWPAWLVLGLLRLAVALPYPWQLGLGRALGWVLRHTMRRRRHIAEVNLSLCFPELSPALRWQTLREHFASLAISQLETAMAWWLPAGRLRPLSRIEGLEHVARLRRQGRPVILLGAHFTTLDIGVRLLALELPLDAMYRELKIPLYDIVMRRGRERYLGRVIPRGDVRAMVRSLKELRPVWYAPDQNYGREHSVFAPFFGVPAASLTVTARVARLSGAAVLPFFQVRLPAAQGYRLQILSPLENFPGGAPEADAARINGVIEAMVRQAPAQYLWVHRRFKTRPPGNLDVY